MHSTDTELLIAVFRLVLAAQAGTYTPNIATEEEEVSDFSVECYFFFKLLTSCLGAIG